MFTLPKTGLLGLMLWVKLNPTDDKYPHSVDVVCEVLSKDEDITSKCLDYAATGKVGQIFVFSPEEQTLAEWIGSKLVPVGDMNLANGVTITGATIWSEMEKRRRATPPISTRI
jgi:hypothetical protein